MLPMDNGSVWLQFFKVVFCSQKQGKLVLIPDFFFFFFGSKKQRKH